MLKNIKDRGNKSPTPTDYDHVSLILEEADKYGLRFEVESTAKVYMERDNIPFVESYQHAFQDWVK